MKDSSRKLVLIIVVVMIAIFLFCHFNTTKPCEPSCDGVPQGESDGCGGVCGSLGCWYDEMNNRAMGVEIISGGGNSIPSLSKCRSQAQILGFKYFGMQDYNADPNPQGEGTSGKCFGSNDMGTIGTRDQPGERGYQMYGIAPSLDDEPVWSTSSDAVEGCYMKNVKGENIYVGSRLANAVYPANGYE